MPRIIEQIRFSKPIVHRLTNVAAYARVSSGKDEMLHSLAAQVDYYKAYIQSNPEWLFAGVYADEALTGTKSNRADFLRLLEDCRSGKIDRILTKSIKVENGNQLVFALRGGTAVTKRWKDRSRSESWTPEKRAAAGKKPEKGIRRVCDGNKECNDDSGYQKLSYESSEGVYR